MSLLKIKLKCFLRHKDRVQEEFLPNSIFVGVEAFQSRCTVSSFDLSFKHGGYNVSKYVKSSRTIAKEGVLQTYIHTFMFSSTKQQWIQRSRSFCDTGRNFFLQFLAKQNIPISAADHALESSFEKCSQGIQLQSSMLVVAQTTKATAIVKECAHNHMTNLADAMTMRNGPFVLGTDGSGRWEKVISHYCKSSWDASTCRLILAYRFPPPF